MSQPITNEMKKVTIFTTPSCHFCNMAKGFFKANDIEFEEKNVASDTDARENMVSMTGQFGVPVIEIGKDLVIGFNQPIIKKLLEIN